MNPTRPRGRDRHQILHEFGNLHGRKAVIAMPSLLLQGDQISLGKFGEMAAGGLRRPVAGAAPNSPAVESPPPHQRGENVCASLIPDQGGNPRERVSRSGSGHGRRIPGAVAGVSYACFGRHRNIGRTPQ